MMNNVNFEIPQSIQYKLSLIINSLGASGIFSFMAICIYIVI
jgi:hypothetical protein